MPTRHSTTRIIASAILCLTTPIAEPQDCAGDLALKVLGSGGPIADDARASSGYLLWRDGQAQALIDAGGGTFQRFGQAGASLDTLELIAITHFHTDHAADLPALLKGAYFSDRSWPLPISGPTGNSTGNSRFPGLEAFLAGLFDADRGTFAYLSGLLDGSGRLFRLDRHAIDHRTNEPLAVLVRDGIDVAAIGIPHGPVPSVAFRFDIQGRVDTQGRRIVISGDQNLSGDGFVEFARGADLLVMPFAIPESAGRAARNLHARPSTIGKAAAEANVGHLLLSHFMARSLADLEAQLDLVREYYDGKITLAEDLQCIELP